MRQRRGFALMAAMWLVVLLGAAAWSLSMSSRARRLAAANMLEHQVARMAVDAGFATALSALNDSLALHDTRSRLDTAHEDAWWSFGAGRSDTLLMDRQVAIVTYRDPASRVHVNRASVGDLRRLLLALEVPADDAERLADRIADWRDADDLPRARGAERAQYLREGARRLPANADFGEIAELRDVIGMTPELFDRLSPCLTRAGVGQVNVNVASAPVLASLPGFGTEVVEAVGRVRRQGRVLHSLSDITRELSHGASTALQAVQPELDNRITFESRQLEVAVTGWVTGSPVNVFASMLVTRTGESAVVEWRRVSDR